MAISTYLSKIIFNVNGLSAIIKDRVAECIHKHDPNIGSLQETPPSWITAS